MFSWLLHGKGSLGKTGALQGFLSICDKRVGVVGAGHRAVLRTYLDNSVMQRDRPRGGSSAGFSPGVAPGIKKHTAGLHRVQHWDRRQV